MFLKAPVIDDPYTGLVAALTEVPRRPHDPDIRLFGAKVAGEHGEDCGGAGLTLEAAQAAALGEVIERAQCSPEPQDKIMVAPLADLAGEALHPADLPLFSPEQYALSDFPFAPFRADRPLGWVRFRRVADGEPVWVPEELAFLHPGGGRPHVLAPSTSTGLSAGPAAGRVVLRGLQEVIERDAVIGGWWGAYAIERLDERSVFGLLGDELARRFRRPNLSYHFYRIASPFSDHVTLATIEGDDHEGPIFSIGSACRETRRSSLEKAAIEAVQGRSYVRFLLAGSPPPPGPPQTFADHAAYYARHPAERARTRLATAPLAADRPSAGAEPEGLAALCARLGARHAPLFRLLTPARVARHAPGWVVARVVCPGLTPLHGAHAFAHLGSPLWGNKSLGAWLAHPPHPFP